MNKNVCKECGTENESEYIYCKNCGAKLNGCASDCTNHTKENNGSEFHEFIGNSSNPSPDSTPYSNNHQYNPGTYNYSPDISSENYSNCDSRARGFYPDSIDGIPTDEMICFVGKKSYQIMPKLSKMELTHSKVSWCWPAAVLGFMFGPLGSAIWFFYRKMYKAALILLVIGMVVTAIITALTFNTNSDVFNTAINALESDGFEGFIKALDSLDTEKTALSFIANAVENIVNIATCILTGIFGYHIYKNHCVEAIRNFRSVTSDQRYYKMGLASVGGISGGMMAVGIAALFFINNIASMITLFFH